MRNNGSCWICRVRHKKCDETHPECQNCTTLGLSCLYGDPKPEWMDNGQLQRQMSQRLKTQVKRNARNRRARQMIDKITQDLNDTRLPPSQAIVDPLSPALNGYPIPLATSTSESTDDTTPASWSHDIDSIDSLNPSQQTNSGESEINSTQDLLLPETSSKFLFGSSFRETLKVNIYGEEDVRFIMSYKDYVFPLLHPFYHPSFFEGGQNWLLVAALRNTESRQLIVSLATYFFSLVPIFPGAGFQLCSTFTWAEVQSQSEQAFKGMQHRVEILGQRGVASNLWETTHLFGDIMLLLEFETMAQHSQVWGIHLDAAIILLKQILASPQLESFVWRVPFNPATMSSQEASQLTPIGAHLFSSTQVAFRFFVAKIIIADIISSSKTTMRR
ncbi:Ff.00g066390.m01.CDS01 [Fusarium sp. VM40]|nr:Ff.00g066390.m01.CDS01 [Fusarium sp. VM40]